jgi:RNA polymerase sigma factor (sigma-70 family)
MKKCIFFKKNENSFIFVHNNSYKSKLSTYKITKMSHFCNAYRKNRDFYNGLKAGENNAYYCLAYQLEDNIRNLCQKESISDWKDVRQDAMILLLMRLEDDTYEFRSHVSLVTYTTEIAKGLILNEKRRQRRKGKLNIDDFINLLKTQNDWNGLKEEVNVYLSYLTNPCKQVIQLHEMEGYRYKEIAQQALIPNHYSDGGLRVIASKCWARLVTVYKIFNKDNDSLSN